MILELLDEKLKELEIEFKQYDRPSLTWCIKTLFASLYGKEENCYRYANGIDDTTYTLIDGDNEFMYDLVVLKEEKNETGVTNIDFIVDTLLALETELHDNLTSVVEDFQKLLLSNANEKVMVFKCQDLEQFEEWGAFLQMCKAKYVKANGKFHLVARMNKSGEFKRVELT